jgi:lipoyl(octanoyl) transferase
MLDSAPPFPTDECLHVPGLPPVAGRAVYLGLLDYGEAWRLQLRLVDAVLHERLPELLLLCQHPDVITVGRRQRARDNILSPRFPTFEVERGGDATYHGPGQLVGYPILKLRPSPGGVSAPSERDLHRYLRALEGGLIDLCAACGVRAGRRAGATGVWTHSTGEATGIEGAEGAEEPRKIASMGIAVRRWVTFHGFALNVTTDLQRFTAINPCGFRAEVMTSLAELSARPPSSDPGAGDSSGGTAGDPAAALSVEALLSWAGECLGARLARRFTAATPEWLAAQLALVEQDRAAVAE